MERAIHTHGRKTSEPTNFSHSCSAFREGDNQILQAQLFLFDKFTYSPYLMASINTIIFADYNMLI